VQLPVKLTEDMAFLSTETLEWRYPVNLATSPTFSFPNFHILKDKTPSGFIISMDGTKGDISDNFIYVGDAVNECETCPLTRS